MELIRLQFEMADGTELQEAAHLIEQRIEALDTVENVEAEPPEGTRFAEVDVATAIAVTILIVRSSRELVAETRKLIEELKGLYGDIKGLKEISVAVKGESVPLDKIPDKEYKNLSTPVES